MLECFHRKNLTFNETLKKLGDILWPTLYYCQMKHVWKSRGLNWPMKIKEGKTGKTMDLIFVVRKFADKKK